jgi:hypothetical protein
MFEYENRFLKIEIKMVKKMKNINKKIWTLTFVFAMTFSVFTGAIPIISGGSSQVPTIQFIKDDNANTLTVASVNPSNVLWSDINFVGTCDTSGLGTYVTAGDVISGCYGTITLTYVPLNIVVGIYEFTPLPTPSIQFIKYDINNRVMVTAADTGYHYSSSTSPSGANLIIVKNSVTYYVLSNLSIGTSGTLSTKEIQAGDIISGFTTGTYSIIWQPTGDEIWSFTFSTSDSEKFIGTWTLTDPPGGEGTVIYKFFSNGNFRWLDINDLGGYNIEGTFELVDSQLVLHWTYPTVQTLTMDYVFSNSDQTLTLSLQGTSMVLTKMQDEVDDTAKIIGKWSVEFPQAPPGWDATIFWEFYSNGSYHLYDPDNLSDYNFQGTWSWVEGQIVLHQNGDVLHRDYFFTNSDQTLTIVIGTQGVFILTKMQDDSNPNMTYQYNDVSKKITITSVDPDHYYSDSSSTDDANLVFVKNGVTFYVISDYYTGLTVETYGLLCTSEIRAGDIISGFTAGTYSIMWRPTGDTIGTFTVSGEETPSIAFQFNNVNKRLTVTSVDPSGYHYSSSTSPSGANLIIVKNSVTYYVLSDLSIGTSGTLSTKEIQAGDALSGFSAGTYSVKWKSTNYVFFVFTVSEDMPSITFIADDVLNTLTVASTDPTNVLWSNIDIKGSCDISSHGAYVAAGDQITGCYGAIGVYYVPTNSLLSTWKFSEKPIIHYGWVYGNVLLKSGDSTYPGKNVTIYIYQSEEDTSNKNIIRPEGTSYLTNESGEYNISSLSAGTYMMEAIKSKLYKSQKFIEIKGEKGTEVNFIIEISETRLEVEKSIASGIIGGEINIERNDSNKFEQRITIYDGVEIRPAEIAQGNISLIVSGNENGGGKTIAITVDPSLFENAKDIIVKYDGEIISMADNITDVLNPNDDGLHAEYLLTLGANATEILISIPHFSEHEITVYSAAGAVVETLGGVNAVFTYIAICAIAAVLFVGAIYIRRRF